MISHLSFEDDSLLFANGDVNSGSILKKSLDTFTMLSELTPNGDKSVKFLAG